MKAEYGDITRTRPDELRVNTSGFAAATAIVPSFVVNQCFARGRETSAGRQLKILHHLLRRGQGAPPPPALALFVPGVHGCWAADFAPARRFMNMAVQAKQRLMRFDCVADRLAAGAVHDDLTSLDDLGWRARVPVKHRAGV